MEVNPNTLQHYGILGMKWGVRRERGPDGRVGTKKSQGSGDYQKSRAQLRRGSKNLSTAELKSLTNRLQLERQYSDLNPSDYKRGMDVVKTITAAGSTAASFYALSKTPLGQDVIKAIKPIISRR